MASALFDVVNGLQLTDNRGFFTANGNVVVNALTTSGGLYWTGNGKSISGIAITASATPPTSPPPSIGDQWYNTSNDVVYQYQFDGTSTYWVDISSTVITANANTSPIDTVITDSIKANLGAYQTFANNRITTIDANIGTAYLGNLSTQANLGAFQNYANTKIGTNTNGNLVVDATTTATSTTTGALVVSGGVGIAGNIHIGGNLNVTGSAWTTYTPTWSTEGTQPDLGDGTIVGRYYQIGKTVFVRVTLSLGSTTTTGTGAWRFSLPVNAYDNQSVVMPATYLDNGVSWYIGTVNTQYAGATSYVTALIGATPSGAVQNTSPFTWGSSDSLTFNGSYESI